MQIEQTFIPGLKILNLDQFIDHRGYFFKVFNEAFFKQNGLEINIKESYYSISHKNVIRGMHFQVSPAEHTKLVYLNQGKIIDVVLDIRQNSSTYGQFFSIELNMRNPVLLYIPVGCAHGFLSLEDDTMVSYSQTSVYDQTCDKGVKYNSFGMKWGIKNPIISNRDLTFPDFADSNYIF